MKGPDDRGARGLLATAARRKRRKHLAALRHLATAECHRDRARAGVTKVEAILAWGAAQGFNMAAEAEQLAALRQALDVAEAGLDAARVDAGFADVA